MAEEEVAHHAGGGIKGFLGKETAGLPNWVWLVVIVAGLAAATILPKIFGNKSSSSSDQGSTDSGTPNSGLGLAIDPTTGLPYAVEGLVPSGGVSASPSSISLPTNTTTSSDGTQTASSGPITQTTPDLSSMNNLLLSLLGQQQSTNIPTQTTVAQAGDSLSASGSTGAYSQAGQSVSSSGYGVTLPDLSQLFTNAQASTQSTSTSQNTSTTSSSPRATTPAVQQQAASVTPAASVQSIPMAQPSPNAIFSYVPPTINIPTVTVPTVNIPSVNIPTF